MQQWIDRYAEGFGKLSAAIEGLPPELLDYKPAPQAWSIREIVAHLADADMVAVYRMKLILTEDNPTLMGFDQDVWAQRLGYAQADIELALATFRQLRASFAPALRAVGEAEWERFGTHNEAGVQTLADVLRNYVNHLDTHLRQIERNKAAYAAR